MLNGREGKYEGSDDSEYHFSDDEVHYEADAESAKQAPVSDIHGGSSASGMSGMSGMKRMGIGLVVFIVLVSLAYKMVAPGSSVPATDITPQVAVPVAANPPQRVDQPQAIQQAAASAPAPQSAQASAPAAQQQSAIQQMQQMSAAPQEAQQPAQQQQMQQPVAAAPQMPVQPGQDVAQSTQPVQNNVMNQAIPAQTAAVAPATGLPASAMPSQAQPMQPMPSAEAGSSTLAMENARLSGQLQAEYTQRLSEYQNQNKNLQDQVQTLNGRVANMESEMNQLIQTLTQQFQGGGTPGVATSSAPAANSGLTPAPVEQAGPAPRVPYNVQAIIPGRAWLRANNGDTVTVAEGDEIKGIGRVTKIDPYDGVVEINVQGRAVTLSYGNGS